MDNDEVLKLVKTHVSLWFNSEGINPPTVTEKLGALGFEPTLGRYDHVYDWRGSVNLQEILEIGTAVHETLKGLKDPLQVGYHLALNTQRGDFV
jgi:hypothetical protein